MAFMGTVKEEGTEWLISRLEHQSRQLEAELTEISSPVIQKIPSRVDKSSKEIITRVQKIKVSGH